MVFIQRWVGQGGWPLFPHAKVFGPAPADVSALGAAGADEGLGAAAGSRAGRAMGAAEAVAIVATGNAALSAWEGG